MGLEKFDLSGKVAVVTGSGSGIGQAAAIGLAGAGAHVVVTELKGRGANAESTVNTIEAAGGKALALELDISDIHSIERLFRDVKDKLGRVDILVNNAGIIIRKPSLEVTEADWDPVLDVNLKGTFFTSQAAAKMMKEQGGGKIVNIASINGVIGFHERAAYCASKGGVVNLTRSLAVEWATLGINVNAIGPNYLLTPITEKIFQNDEFRNDVLYRTPMKRIGTPDDVVGAILFLSAPASDFVTGQILPVDGGWTAW